MNVFIMRSLQARARTEIAHSFEVAAFLRKKLESLLREEADVVDLLSLAERQMKMVEGYKPIVAGRYQCPCCATASSEAADLIENQSKPGMRRFSCPACEQDFEFDLERLRMDTATPE
jgi:hypothetical protein